MTNFTISLTIQAVNKASGVLGQISNQIGSLTRKSFAGGGGGGSRGAGGGGLLGLGGSIGNLSTGLVAGVAGAKAAIEGAVGAYNYFTKASDDAALAQQRLTKLMSNVKGTTKAQIQGIVDLTSKIESQGVIQDDTLQAGASQLATYQLTAAQIRKLLPALGDLQAGMEGVNTTQEGAINAANLIGKVFTGQVGALRRAGVSFSKVQEYILKNGTAAQKTAMIIKVLGQNYGGLNKSLSETTKGKEVQVANMWNNVSEKIGASFDGIRLKIGRALVAIMPTLSAAADRIPDVFSGVGGVLQKNFGPGVTSFVSNLRQQFKGIKLDSAGAGALQLMAANAKALNPLLGLLGKIIGGVGAALVQMWVNSQPALARIVAAFDPIIQAVTRLWDRVLGPLVGWLGSTLIPFVIGTLAPVFEVLGKAIGQVIDWLTDAIVAVVGWVAKAWPKISNFFTTLWSRIKLSVIGFGATLMNAWQAIWEPVFKWLQDRWNTVTGIFDRIRGFFGLGGSGETGGGGGPKPQTMSGSPRLDGGIAPFFVPGPGSKGVEKDPHARVELVMPDGVKGRIIRQSGINLTLGPSGMPG